MTREDILKKYEYHESEAGMLLQRMVSDGPGLMAEVMQKHDLSYTQLAKRTGFTAGHLCNIRRGRHRMSPDCYRELLRCTQDQPQSSESTAA